jgi:hypothetical protein
MEAAPGVDRMMWIRERTVLAARQKRFQPPIWIAVAERHVSIAALSLIF